MAFYYKPKSREDIFAEGVGLAGESFPLSVAAAASAVGSGDIRGTLTGFRAGEVLSKIWVSVGAAGADITRAQVALLTKAGVVLAKSADSAGDRTAVQTVGFKGLSLTLNGADEALTSYTITSNDVYYLCYFNAATTTSVSLQRGGVFGTGSVTSINSAPLMAFVQTGQSSMPSTVTVSTGLTTPPWFGWS